VSRRGKAGKRAAQQRRLAARRRDRPEAQEEVGKRRGAPLGGSGSRVGRTGAGRETALERPLGGQFEPADRGAQPPDVARLRIGEPAPQPAQRHDDLAAQIGDRPLGGGEAPAVEAAATGDPEPQPEEDQIDVAAVPVLQRDECRGDTGQRIKGEREAPERRSCRPSVRRHSHRPRASSCRPRRRWYKGRQTSGHR